MSNTNGWPISWEDVHSSLTDRIPKIKFDTVFDTAVDGEIYFNIDECQKLTEMAKARMPMIFECVVTPPEGEGANLVVSGVASWATYEAESPVPPYETELPAAPYFYDYNGLMVQLIFTGEEVSDGTRSWSVNIIA